MLFLRSAFALDSVMCDGMCSGAPHRPRGDGDGDGAASDAARDACRGEAKSEDDARRIAESFDFSGAFALAPNEPWLHPTSLNSPGDGHEPLSSVPSVTQVCAHHEPGICQFKLLLIHTADHSS